MNGSKHSSSDQGPRQAASSATGLTPQSEELMRFIDGELDEMRAREVSAYLTSHPAERARAQRMMVASDALARDLLGRAAAVGADAIADGVMARIEADARASSPSRARRAGSSSNLRYLAPAAGVVGVALAAAAACVVWLRTAGHADFGAYLGKLSGSDGAEVAGSVEQGRAVRVESVDFGSRAGTVFYVTDAPDRPATPVVWVTDDELRSESGE